MTSASRSLCKKDRSLRDRGDPVLESESILSSLGQFEGDRAASLLNSRAWLENDRAEQASEAERGGHPRPHGRGALDVRFGGSVIGAELASDDYGSGVPRVRSVVSSLVSTGMRTRSVVLTRRSASSRRRARPRTSCSTCNVTGTLGLRASSRVRGRYAFSRCADAQEQLAEQRGSPGAWRVLEETCLLLAEIHADQGDGELEDSALSRARRARDRADIAGCCRLSSPGWLRCVLRPHGPEREVLLLAVAPVAKQQADVAAVDDAVSIEIGASTEASHQA